MSRLDLRALPRKTLQLDWVFGDHMVVQRGRPLVVSGTGAPGTDVTVRFGAQRGSTRVPASGRWRARLPAPDVGAPRALRVRAGDEQVELLDVAVGDVWICAGQSNMAFPLARAVEGEVELRIADAPGLRLLNRRATPWPSAGAFPEAALAKTTPRDLFQGTWARSSRAAAAQFSAVGYFFARALQPHVDVPLGVIHVAVGGSTTESWIPRAALAADEVLAPLARDYLATPLTQPWVRDRARANLGAHADAEPRPAHPLEPGLLFDAAIGSLAPFAVRGALWYQGESNADHPELQVRLFTLLAREWRAAFEQPELPILFTQLPGMNRPTWPAFRAAQARCLQVPHTAMAVTIELGAEDDVHPPDKRPVGARLALLARKHVYGEELRCHGPRVVEAGFAGDVTLRFDARVRDRDGGAVVGFELAGADGVFKAAHARLDGARATVFSEAVARPTSVRYAWAPFSACDLSGSGHLPVAPFTLHDERLPR